jgi:hypothetical protein
MRIVTTTVARNEADVLEAFVRHHAGLVDRMVIVCHCCQDTSNELLRALQAEGLPLDVDAVDDPVFDQHCASTDLLEEAARRYDPEWILPLDADEFLVGDVVRATDGLSEERAALLAWKSYVLRPEDDRRETNVLRRIQYRVAESSGAKVMVPRVLRRRRRLGVGEGNHGVYERTTGARVPHARTSALALAHFPVRSEEQLRAKVLGGWPTRRAAACGCISSARGSTRRARSRTAA